MGRGVAQQELEVRADHPEGFIDGVAGAFLDHYFRFGLLVFRNALLPDLGDHSGKRYLHELEVVPVLDRGGQQFLQQEDKRRKHEADQDGHQVDPLRHRLDGGPAAVGGLHKLGVVGCEGLRELVLLPLLEEEQVERLLDLLLALHRQQVVGLAGILGHAAHGFVASGAKRVLLHLEHGDLVGEGVHDRGAQRRQLLVEVDYQRVLRGRICEMVVAAQDQLVVLRDALEYGSVLDIGVDRYLLAVVPGGREILVRGAQLAYLHCEFGALLCGFVCLRDGHGSGRRDVGDEVLGLVRRDVVVHVAELLLDDGQAVADELVGADYLFVAVPHPLLVIDGDESVKDIVRPLERQVAVADVDNRRTLVPEARAGAAAHLVRRGRDAGARHLDVRVAAPVEAGGCLRGDAAHLCVDGIPGAQVQVILRERLPVQGHLAEDDDAVLLDDIDRHRCAGVVVEVEELDGHGELHPVEGPVVEGPLLQITHGEVEPADDLLGDDAGFHQQDFVGDIGRGLVDAELPHGLVHAVAAVGLDHYGGRPEVHRRRTLDQEPGDSERQDERKDEPVPVLEDLGE